MTEVFELTYHGGGGFTYTEVWNMDVPKRRFNLKKISEYLKKVEEARDEQQQKLTDKSDFKKVQIPDHVNRVVNKNKSVTKSDSQPFVSKVKAKN